MARRSVSSCNWRIAALLGLVALAGCGGKQFGTVTGRVTLDGVPLEGTTVEFQPDSGSPSYGVTDSDGNYSLTWSPERAGAQVGQHTVRITSFRESMRKVPERVPERYNRKTELQREVKGGSQRFDFPLTSK